MVSPFLAFVGVAGLVFVVLQRRKYYLEYRRNRYMSLEDLTKRHMVSQLMLVGWTREDAIAKVDQDWDNTFDGG